MRRGTGAVLAIVLTCSPSLGRAQACDPAAVESDRARIRAHLAEVEAELRAAPVDHLDDARRAARATNLDRLHEYAARGEFPHGSPDQPGTMVPTFIDAGGRPCAMAHLVIESGFREVAEEIARTELHAYVPEIRHPALGPWLDANGMTLAEAARVQPGYTCSCPVDASVYCSSAFCWGPDPCDPVLVPCTAPMPCGFPPPWLGPATCDDAGVCTCPYPPTPGTCGLGPPPSCDDAGRCVCPGPDSGAELDAGGLDGGSDAGVRRDGATDAGVSVDAPRDAARSMDASRAVDGGLAPGAGSCGCRLGARRPPPLAGIAIAALVLVALRRRRV